VPDYKDIRKELKQYLTRRIFRKIASSLHSSQ